MNFSLSSETLFVTGNHRVVTGDWRDPQWRPPGLHHARRAGDAWTLCGLRALEWPIFWEMRFAAEDVESCPACACSAMTLRSPSKDEDVTCV